MATSKFFTLRLKRAGAMCAAFSLIEVTMAMGIVAFGFIGVLGLLPMGMNTFHQATGASVTVQIAQRVINEVQQTDFSALAQAAAGSNLRYFDDQGNEVDATDKQRIIYCSNTRIVTSTVSPYTGTTLTQGSENTSLATAVIQITANPGNNRPIDSDSKTNLWSDPRFAISVYSAIVAKNE